MTALLFVALGAALGVMMWASTDGEPGCILRDGQLVPDSSQLPRRDHTALEFAALAVFVAVAWALAVSAS